MSRKQRIYWVEETGNVISITEDQEMPLREAALASGRRGVLCYQRTTNDRWMESTIKADGFIWGRYKNPPDNILQMAIDDGVISAKGKRK